MTPYINLHTHHVSADHGVFVFNNRVGAEPLHTDSLFSAGVHPWDAALLRPEEELESLLAHPQCFALGECGLDKVRGPAIEIQKAVFAWQLALAFKYQKPVIIHCVKAFEELVEISENYVTHVPLIIHGFQKSAQLAAQLIAKGFYLSLSPALFKKAAFPFQELPLSRIFLETDLLPNGEIAQLYQQAALTFNISLDDLKEQIYLNFKALK